MEINNIFYIKILISYKIVNKTYLLKKIMLSSNFLFDNSLIIQIKYMIKTNLKRFILNYLIFVIKFEISKIVIIIFYIKSFVFLNQTLSPKI